MIDILQVKTALAHLEGVTFLSDESMSNSEMPVYPVLYSPDNSHENKAVLKILTQDQAALYQHLTDTKNPYLEKIYTVGYCDDIFYSINEFIPRPDNLQYKLYDEMYPGSTSSLTLYQYIQNYNILEKSQDGLHFIDEKSAMQLVLELIDGLETLYAEGFVHGDLSPQNILLTNPINDTSSTGFSLKIIDFGTIRTFKPDDHPVTQVAGTKEFSAPEILAYNVPNDRIDIYSLGCILHYMCLGISPTEKGLDYGMTLLSPGLINIIKACTDEYSTRYQSLKQLKKAILKEIRLPSDMTGKMMSRLPGFRTNRLWKKIIASFYYLWLIAYIIYSIVFMDFSYQTWLFIGLCIAWVVFVCDAFQIGRRIRWYSKLTRKHRSIRYLTKILIFILLYIVYWILWYI